MTQSALRRHPDQSAERFPIQTCEGVDICLYLFNLRKFKVVYCDHNQTTRTDYGHNMAVIFERISKEHLN